MENRAYALAAGLFTLLLGAALVAVAFWFSKDDMSLVPYVVTTTRSVSGLKTDAAVRYRGVEVGRVESIRIEPGSEGRILIRIGVSVDTPVTKGTYARLGFQGVTGLAFISLDDDGSSPVRLSSHGRELAQIQKRPAAHQQHQRRCDRGQHHAVFLGKHRDEICRRRGDEPVPFVAEQAFQKKPQ